MDSSRLFIPQEFIRRKLLNNNRLPSHEEDEIFYLTGRLKALPRST